MTESECVFCTALKLTKRIHKFSAERAILDNPELGKYCSEYTVALVQHTWYKAYGKRHAGRTVDYRHRGLGYKLRYCPECGRKL